MSHPHHDIFENRKQFQLERLILFSDAVFAIAITLLVIEIKVPDFGSVNPTEAEVTHAIREKIAEFFGFFMSFAVIGLFWAQHHRLFGLITDFDNRLLWLNLHMLFWIILTPFSSALNSRYGNLDFVWEWYSFNMFMVGLSLFFLWTYIGNPEKNLSVLADDPIRRKYAIVRSLSVALIFLSGLLLCLFDWTPTSVAARFVYFLIFPAMVVVTKLYNKKAAKNNPAS